MDPLREGGYAAGEEGRGESRKQADITAVFPENYYFHQSCFGKYSTTHSTIIFFFFFLNKYSHVLFPYLSRRGQSASDGCRV